MNPKISVKENLVKLEDGTIVDLEGNIRYFSINRFVKDIVNGDCCFICGAKPEEKSFNNEHVLPDWVLSRYGLHGEKIYLPNRSMFQYGKYVIPCCNECNSLMGNKIEKPISELTSRGYEAFSRYLKENGPWLIFTWLCLIFIKTHLKDRSFRFNLDRRQPDNKISDFFSWESFHHIHTIARSFYTNCEINSTVMGTLLIVPVKKLDTGDNFDFGDVTYGKGILIRLDDICLISILDDSCFSANLYSDSMKKINGPLSTIQSREILARLSYINMNLKERPEYYSEFDQNNKYTITAELPAMAEFEDTGTYKFGNILSMACLDIFEKTKTPNKDFIIQKIKDGNFTFLFDKYGSFIKDSFISLS